MRNDKGQQINEAYPGQAVYITAGFKHVPEIGHPLYTVSSHEEALFMTNQIKTRREKEHDRFVAEHDKIFKMEHDLRKQVHGLSSVEKGRVYSGDRTPIYDKLGILDESDLERYRRKLHIKDKSLDLTNLADDDIQEILNRFKVKKSKPYMQPKKQYDIEEFKRIVKDFRQEKEKVEGMDPEEREKYLEDKNQLKDILRPDSEEKGMKHYPLIIKASSAGTLETLITEVEKIMGDHHSLQLIDFGIGAITEGDMQNAATSGAVIFGFDVGIHPPIEKKAASPEGVCIRLHKLIGRFIDDIQNYYDYA